MTTFQDPPLHSRRAVRQGDRPDASSSSPFAPPQVPRTAAGVGEPLNYVTQNRPPLPGYDTANHGRRAADAQVPPTMAAPPAAAPEPTFRAPEQPGYRARDFSPEARTAPSAWAPVDDRDSGVVEYHTQARAQIVPPASLASSLASEPTEQTLTRREMRAIREAAGLSSPEPTTTVTPTQGPAASTFAPPPSAFVAPAAFPAPVAPAPLPTVAPEFVTPVVPEEPLSRRARRAATPPAETPHDGGFESLFAAPEAAPAAPSAPAPALPPALVEPQAPAPVAFTQPAAPPTAAPAEPSPLPVTLPPAAVAPAPTTGERPAGHWTMQGERDDFEQASETTISRRVGSGAITTSALVLPSLPGHDMSTGEVLLTDSVSLPSSLAATGAHSPIDQSDIDHLLDPGDHQVNTDSVPIRAVRAVSSHTLTRDVIAASKPQRGNRALTILIASASAMVVVVVTLLVVAVATGGL